MGLANTNHEQRPLPRNWANVASTCPRARLPRAPRPRAWPRRAAVCPGWLAACLLYCNQKLLSERERDMSMHCVLTASRLALQLPLLVASASSKLSQLALG